MDHSVSFVEPTTVSLAETSLLSTPPPESISTPSKSDEKKPAKKRKSWGQELPTPKTNLPPRKRAKTEDEKEQRRIERVLRNRQAAQSSRERKRLEVEKLEGERDMIHDENRALKTRLMAVEEEKFQMRQQMEQMREMMKKNGLELPSPPTSPILPPQSTDLFNKSVPIKQEFGTAEFYETPSSQPSDHLSSVISGDSVSAEIDFPNSIVTSDLAQHPAEMLCGLQCQSQATCKQDLLSQALAATQLHQHQHQLLLFLTVHSIIYSNLVTPLFQLLASLKKGTRLRVETLTPTTFNLILWLISTPISPLKPSKTKNSTSIQTSSSILSPLTSTPQTQSSTFRISLLRRLLSCSPALARPLKDATARALQGKTKYALRKRSEPRGTGVEDTGEVDQTGRQSSKTEVWRLMTLWMATDQYQKEKARSKR